MADLRRIIDVSEFNGAIDWPTVAPHCDGAIIKVGYRGWGSGAIVSDKQAQYNLASAYAAGVPVGIYIITQAITEAEAIQEADWTVAELRGRPCRLPICFDDEPAGGANGRGRRDRIDKATRTATAIAFMKRIQELGYTPALYCSNSWFRDMIDGEAVRAAGALVWISSYPASRGGTNVPPTVAWDGWQYSPYGTLPGMTGDVDMSWFAPERSSDDASEWSAAARDWAIANGLVQGDGSGDYLWQEPLTREQFVTILHRYDQR